MFDLPTLLQDFVDFPLVALLLAVAIIRELLRMRYGLEVAKLLKKHPEHAAAIIDATLRRWSLFRRPPAKGG